MRSIEGYLSNTVYNLPSPDTSYCVEPGKCYIFTMTDKACDGMCCTYGLGYYRAFLEGKQIFKGGTFEDKDSIELCVPSGDDDEFFVRTSRPSSLPTERPTEAPIRQRTNSPTEMTVPKPDSFKTTSPSTNPSILPSLSPSEENKKTPTIQFSGNCIDSSDFQYKKNVNWDCGWLSKRGNGRKRKICKKKSRAGKVSHQCKKTCAEAGVGPCVKKRLGRRKRIAAVENLK